MASVTCTVEIDRPPSEVFPFVTDPSYFGEWQKGVVCGRVEGEPALGSTCSMTRKIGGAERMSTSLITEYTAAGDAGPSAVSTDRYGPT